MANKVVTAFSPLSEKPSHTQTDYTKDEDIVGYCEEEYVVKTGEGDTDFVKKVRVKEFERKNRQDYIDSFADDVGILNVLKKCALSGASNTNFARVVQWDSVNGWDSTSSQGNKLELGSQDELADASHNFFTLDPNGTWKADLSNATAASINSIRYAFACQKYLERCNFGTRYFEILSAHYGVTSPDATLQRPEYLGGTMFNINVNQVTSVAGYAAGVSTTVGETGAVSVTTNRSTLFTKGFCEFGFVYILISTVHDRSYCQGVEREDMYEDRFEFFSPEFANLGDQEIKNKELMLTGTNDEKGFGFNEHWVEMTTFRNRATGMLDPNVPNALDFWTLAEKFPTRPTLSDAFIQENRDCLTRCLKTGATGPDYIASFYFDYTATREKSLYTIPGLVDHVGNM